MCLAEKTGRFITLATSGAAKDPVSSYNLLVVVAPRKEINLAMILLKLLTTES